MSRTTGVVIALATAAAVLTGSTAGAAPPTPAARVSAPAAELPLEIPGGVELTLADGDLLRVYAAADHRTVWARRQEAGTGVWGERSVVLKRKRLSCGDVEARTANGAVVVLAECDRGSWSEDQAPVASVALHSADTVSWSAYGLEGEAYEEPGISPDGSRGVWPESGGYVTRGPEGFTRHALATPGQEYTATATITDTGQVSYLYGAYSGGRCPLVVLTRTGDTAPDRQALSIENGCQDSGLANVDSDTVLFGDLADPGNHTVVARPGASSPWTVTAIAPATAPGLARSGSTLHTMFFTAPGQPLFAVGSRGRHVVKAQTYDPVRQVWGPATTVHDAGQGRCTWGDNWWARPPAVVVAAVSCAGRNLVLTTRDGAPWQALRMGRHPYGLSPDARYVAVPGRSRTYVLSPELGVVALPGGVTGRCDVVVPDGPDAAVLLTSAGRHRGWPTVLRASTAEGWRTLSRTQLPTFPADCVRARSSNADLPFRFDVYSRWTGYTVQVVERDGGWTVRRSRA